MLALQLLDIAIILLIAALGLRARPADVLLLIRAPRLGARALSALFVFAPACTLLLTLSMPMKPAIRASLLALSVAPPLHRFSPCRQA